MPAPPASFPSPSADILRRHLLGIAGLGTAQALAWVLPFLARQRFAASNWQTTILTAAVPTTQLFTIFWNHIYARVSTRTYLALIALFACLPVALIGAASGIVWVMLCFVIAALGGAGGAAAFAPLNADLLRTCYAAGIRGRVYGLISAVQYLAIMVTGQAMGWWTDRNPDAFRWFMPLTGLCMLLGLSNYYRISRAPLFHHRGRPIIAAGAPWFAPIRAMRTLLARDHRFAAYETAFMAYGFGWMICTNLLPVLGDARLHLSPGAYALSTVTIYQLTTILLIAPLGRAADRIGYMRLAAISFAWLTLYPLGLIFTATGHQLAFFQTLYAIGMTGVQLTWTLGPVALAPDPADAPAYLAIHGTLVGVRAIVGQGLGMLLYGLTGRFEVPLLLGAVGFLWAALRMRDLLRTAPPAR